MVGIYKIQEDLGLTDSEILRSIEIHTVGSHEMSTLDKIVYVVIILSITVISFGRGS